MTGKRGSEWSGDLAKVSQDPNPGLSDCPHRGPGASPANLISTVSLPPPPRLTTVVPSLPLSWAPIPVCDTDTPTTLRPHLDSQSKGAGGSEGVGGWRILFPGPCLPSPPESTFPCNGLEGLVTAPVPRGAQASGRPGGSHHDSPWAPGASPLGIECPHSTEPLLGLSVAEALKSSCYCLCFLGISGASSMLGAPALWELTVHTGRQTAQREATSWKHVPWRH